MTKAKNLIGVGVVLLACVPLFAQQITGSIRGTVADSSGALVAGATVTARQTETGLTRTATTDHGGNYLLLELPVGHYALEVTAKGFQKYLQEGISLNVNETAAVAAHLAVGTETQQVQVKADAELIQPTVTSLGQVVEEREILDLPLDGRNFAQLGLLQPGVVPLPPGLLQAGGPARQGQPYAVDGQRPESNNFLIDGADNVNAVDAGFVIKPPIDSIAEFRILTHNANAEFGRNTFSRSVQPLTQNQFGGTFGGPIVKDKTFFFGYYEGFRNRQGETVPATVPSLAERQGNFGQLCTSIPHDAFVGGICTNTVTNMPDFNGQLLFLAAPSPVPIPSNQLTSIDPVATNVLPFFPRPNRGTNGFVATQSLSHTGIGFRVHVCAHPSRGRRASVHPGFGLLFSRRPHYGTAQYVSEYL